MIAYRRTDTVLTILAYAKILCLKFIITWGFFVLKNKQQYTLDFNLYGLLLFFILLYRQLQVKVTAVLIKKINVNNLHQPGSGSDKLKQALSTCLQSALHSTTTRAPHLPSPYRFSLSNSYLSLLLFFNLVRTYKTSRITRLLWLHHRDLHFPFQIRHSIWLAAFCLLIQSGWNPPSPSSKIWHIRRIGKNHSANEAGYAAWIGGVPAHPDPHQVSCRICSSNSRRCFFVSSGNLASQLYIYVSSFVALVCGVLPKMERALEARAWHFPMKRQSFRLSPSPRMRCQAWFG